MADAQRARIGQEGSRWYNERPAGEDVAKWFQTVPLHEGLKHDDYIGGVVLIQSKEKSEEVIGFRDDGGPVIAERQNLVYVPYVKVETRVAYFWALMRQWDAVGVWEPVPVESKEPLGLPEGFFRISVAVPNRPGEVVNFVGCNMQVRAFKKDTVKYEWGGPYGDRVVDGEPLLIAPPAQKVVPVAFKYSPDPNAVHKAATGAIGRALGMAGMLIVPGSGVATAEDMMELRDPPAGATSDAAELPDEGVPGQLDDEQLRARASELVAQLEEQSPEKHAEFQEWARGRKLILAEAQGPVLKGAVKKLEKTLDEAGQVAA